MAAAAGIAGTVNAAVDAAVAGGVTVGVAGAAGAFSYNRGNFMNDIGFRFERFCSAREFANQQSEQYRGDLRNLAALTAKKNGVWMVTSSLTMALNVALYCAGRLGLHGPSPPGWIMGLWLTNNAASFSFMAICMFIAIHASFRAQAASVHLLTRKTRLPIPTLRQLDDARQFASEYEQQSWSDIFRIPYLSNNGAPHTDEADYAPQPGSPSTPGSRSRARSAPSGRGRSKCSSWVRAEFETDRAGTVKGPTPVPDAAPEHFQLFKAVQKEFYQYDIYARVALFYGFIHYVQSLCYYGLGHINIELRAFWVAYATVFVIAVLMALILRFDVIPANKNKKEFLPRCEYCGPLAVLPAAIGMSLDFQVQYSRTAIDFCWLFIFIAYILQLIYALRLLELCLPDEAFAGAVERLGGTVLPAGWRKVPSSFYHVWYFVSPPDKLQPGQHDIVRDIKYGGTGATAEVLGGTKAVREARDVNASLEEEEYAEADDDRQMHSAMPAFAATKHIEPWKFVAALAGVMPVLWVFLICGTLVDVAIGEQALVTAPHWSRPPMTRLSLEPHELGSPLGFPWPAADRPYLPEQMAWHEEKRHADMYSLHRRRLEDASVLAVPPRGGAGLSSALRALLEALPAAAATAPGAAQAVGQRIAWPGFFEPQLLACGSEQVAALTPRGFGAAAAVDTLAGAEAEPVAAESFRLSGLSHLPPLVGASWGKEGLVLVSRGGDLVSCPGARPQSGGVWACRAPAGLPSTVPMDGDGALRAAAAAWVDGRLHAALVQEDAPEIVAIFSHDQVDNAWTPFGELRVPGDRAAGRLSVSFAGADVVVATEHGHVLRRRLADGALVSAVEHAVRTEGAAWKGACGLRGDALAHLRLRRRGQVSLPEVVSVTAAQAVKELFQ